MQRYFLDTNVILDFLGNRLPFSKYALAIFKKMKSQEWELWTSDNSITTTYYLLEKEIGTKMAKQKIQSLLDLIEIQPVRKVELQLALISRFNDFEDGVQHYCALSHGQLDGIITRNKKDFRHSHITVFSPDELFDADQA